MPISGKQILVTQAIEQAAQQIENLKNRGAAVIHKPLIAVRPVDDHSGFDDHLREVEKFDWILFTSANSAGIFSKRLDSLGSGRGNFTNVRIGAVGQATVQALTGAGFKTDFVPQTATAAGFLLEFTKEFQNLSGSTILFPAGNIAREVLPAGLRDAGADVIRVTVYTTEPVEYPPDDITGLFDEYQVDLATFTSSSAVDNLMKLIPEKKRPGFISKLNAASIGPMTTKTMLSYGIHPVAEARKRSVSGLVEAVAVHFQHS
jgi:uroporphyrinogen III methyltransferase/synthase